MGYINLVFGIEMAIRSVRKERFAPRGKWNTSICIAVIAFMLLLTWIPTIVWPMTRHCFASLIWFPIRYEFVALVLISIMIFSFLALAALISIQLMRTVKVDPNERISASRMCYYLIIATIIYVSNCQHSNANGANLYRLSCSLSKSRRIGVTLATRLQRRELPRFLYSQREYSSLSFTCSCESMPAA